MKVISLVDFDKIQEGLQSLTDEFISGHAYYAEWIQKNEQTFKDRTRIVCALTEGEEIVGYMMIHYSSERCAKINGIFVYPEYQKRGYAKNAIIQVLEKFKEQNYEYAFIQTTLDNQIVIHMFEILNFDVIGQNYHDIEKQNNWLAVFDLKGERNFSEMNALARQLYPGFNPTKYYIE